MVLLSILINQRIAIQLVSFKRLSTANKKKKWKISYNLTGCFWCQLSVQICSDTDCIVVKGLVSLVTPKQGLFEGVKSYHDLFQGSNRE